jgi:hypothetical protein
MSLAGPHHSTVLSIPDVKRNKYLALEIQQKQVDPKRVEWVVLPPVALSRNTTGRYQLAKYNDEAAWIY